MHGILIILKSLISLLIVSMFFACNNQLEAENKEATSLNKYLKTYPREIDSLIIHSLSMDYNEEIIIDSSIVYFSSVWTGENWKIDGTRYTAEIKMNNSDIWIFSFRRPDLFIVGKNKVN